MAHHKNKENHINVQAMQTMKSKEESSYENNSEDKAYKQTEELKIEAKRKEMLALELEQLSIRF
jgi:hypothetical protein